jgi:hypothetical protein
MKARMRSRTDRVLYFWQYLARRFLTLFSNMFTKVNPRGAPARRGMDVPTRERGNEEIESELHVPKP